MSAKRMGPLGRLSCGERLIIERRRLKETQEEAAKRFDVSSFTYGRWERDDEKGPLRRSFSLTKAERCLLYRRRLGWTQALVAYTMGRSRWWINLMERDLISSKELITYWEM